jgi:hypothetical protein
MACIIDESSLPMLSGCPGANEWIVVGNAVGGLDANGLQTIGYGRRLWKDISACAVQAIKFMFQQFTVGQPGSPMNAGDDVLNLNFSSLGITSIIQDSIFITLAGPELPRENTDQLSYAPLYNSGNVVVNFLSPVQNGQLYILHYAYTE